MKTLFTLIIAFIGLTLFSCRKDKNADNSDLTKYFYLSNSLTPYKFKTGSYWIYENDSTSTLDSVVVTSTENDFYWSPPSVHGQPGTKYEFYKINLKSFATSQTYNDYLTNSYIKRNGSGDYGQNGQPIFMANRDTGTIFNGMKIIAKFPTMTINSNSFINVVETKITASQQYQPMFSYDTYLYFTDTIGLIKKVTDLGSSNLESWSIKRWAVTK